MSPFERSIEYLTSFSFSFNLVLKGFFLFGMLFYLAFGVIVVRQVGLMSKTLNVILGLPIKLIAWIHLVLIIGLLLIILLAL